MPISASWTTAQKLGVDLPIVPGIMPITNYTQLARFSGQLRRGNPALDSQARWKATATTATRFAPSGWMWSPTCVERLLERRRAGPAFLHHEPGRTDAGDLRTAGADPRIGSVSPKQNALPLTRERAFRLRDRPGAPKAGAGWAIARPAAPWRPGHSGST
ncbi:MAG: methylenetetrahydrofolate reductase [Chromatiales bacterium]|nr:methylenetetrahydrofolate reductase [Chromatiales bacterium]